MTLKMELLLKKEAELKDLKKKIPSLSKLKGTRKNCSWEKAKVVDKQAFDKEIGQSSQSSPGAIVLHNESILPEGNSEIFRASLRIWLRRRAIEQYLCTMQEALGSSLAWPKEKKKSSGLLLQLQNQKKTASEAKWFQREGQLEPVRPWDMLP